MKGNFINKSLGFLFGALVLICLSFNTNDLKANRNVGSLNRPQVPLLSLIGGSSYERDWYPDGRIWLPKKHNGPREFLLPVFVDNRWYSYSISDGNGGNYTPIKVDPIRSFRFKVLYDSSAVRAVGVQTHGPRHNPDDLDYTPLASQFNITWHDTTDFSYWWYLRYDGVSPPPAIDYTKGRGITIAGTSGNALPNTDLQSEEFKVLLYIRFEVIPQYFSGAGNSGQNTPIYISNDTIKYNDLNITTDTIFKKERLYDSTGIYNNEYGYPLIPPTNFYNYSTDAKVIGLSGMDSRIFQEGILPDKQMPGVVYLRYMDTLPKFSFEISRGIGITPGIKPSGNGEELWIIQDPITVDENSNSPYPRTGTRKVDLLNVSTTTRLQDITIESDSKWLKFKTVGATGAKNISLGRFGHINWLDNGILGPNGVPGPLGEVTTAELNRITLEVTCDPAELEGDDPKENPNDPDYNETTGMYVGYITVHSPNAAVQTVRMKVTFIYFRNPLEGSEPKEKGIRLSLRNSRSGGVQSTKLVFGTGHRGTIGVDSLFGEFGYESPLQGFGARFYPVDNVGNEIVQDAINYPGYFGNGLGDFASNDEENDPNTPNNQNKKSASRDIRSYADTLQSILYKVKFDAGDANNYPIVLTWDVKDFPDSSQLYIRDTENGKKFPAVDMRSSNLINNGVYSYTFFDAEIKEFFIEYTLPKVIEYVDEKGLPIIKKGWNLLSLAVKPFNPTPSDYFGNKNQSAPYYFYQSGYIPETAMREGVGYFVKFNDQIPTKFSGTFISEVSLAKNNAVELYPGDTDQGGWNAIGALSTPVSINCIDFDRYDAQNTPRKDFMIGYGVWGYKAKEGYKEVTALMPGLGYWIKVDKRGYLKLKQGTSCKVGSTNDLYDYKSDVRSNSTEITISDNGQSSTSVYLTNNKEVDARLFGLPPVPGEGLFDVRFDNNGVLSNNETSIISMQGIEYPIAISVNNAFASYELSDAVTGEVYGTITKGGNSTLVITKAGSNQIKVKRANVETGSDLSTLSCYPNPTTGNTNFNFFLNENSEVNFQVVDQIGNVIANFTKEFNSGDQTYSFDASALTSGSYLVRIVAGNYNAVANFTVVK